jgi:GT2 family glycosyltransferase
LECLLALLRHADELPSVEYVLLDDGSLEDVEEVRLFLKHMKESFNIRIKFHRQHRGIGYASIMTQATRLAEGRFLVLLNNDVVVMKGALRALYSLFQDFDNVGIASPLFVQSDGRILDAGGIIFTDSSGWQYGRGVPENDPRSHAYTYTRG